MLVANSGWQDPSAFGQRILELERLAAEQKARLEELMGHYSTLREEHDILCSCVSSAGISCPTVSQQSQHSARCRAATPQPGGGQQVPLATHALRQAGNQTNHPSSARRSASVTTTVASNGVGVGGRVGGKEPVATQGQRMPLRTVSAGNTPQQVPTQSVQQLLRTKLGDASSYVAPAPISATPSPSLGLGLGPGSALGPTPPVHHLKPPGVYVVGGHASGFTLAGMERLDLETGWEMLPDMPTPRHGCASASVVGVLYVFGGANDSGLPLDVAERFDPVTRRWESLPALPTARHGSAGVAVAGVLYVIGGYDGEGVLSANERFDPAANRWEVLPSMPTPRGRCTAGCSNGTIIVAGGTDDSGSELALVEQLDPMTRTWSMLAPMPTPRAGCSSVVAAGGFFVIGGRNGSEKLETLERFDLSRGVWETLEPMPTARDGCGATSLDGEIYVFGGRGVGQTLASIEKYNPKDGVWTSLQPMSKARCGLAVAVAER